jgi:DNA topoisomerase-3
MSGSIVIAEKPSQARDYVRAVGSRYGKVLAARGHLFELASPEKVNPEWKEWTASILRPPSGFYPTEIKSDPGVQRLYREIREAAKNASTIYIATDPDREGEGIGGNILAALRRDLKWNGRVLRVLPLGTDDKSLQEAFAQARPADEFRPLFQSYVARSQADQIFNLSLTRSASVTFKPPGWRGPLSVGRVLTPTLGIVCRRERELANFRPRKYYLPWIDAMGDAGTVRLTFNPGEEGRLFDQAEAESLASQAAAYQGPISVEKARKKQGPPPLFSLSKLQAEASRRLKWGVEKTARILQSLYETHQVATYPRSSEISLPEAEIANAPAMMKGILRLPFIGDVSWSGEAPVIRKKRGAFSDKDLKGAAHYAIVPNVNTVDKWGQKWDAMNGDERALFEIIARRYLAVIGPDREYDSTKMSVTVAGRVYAVSGSVERVPGWKEATGKVARLPGNDAGDDSENGEDEGDAGDLPPFKDGDPVRATDAGVAEKVTTPPPRYTTATLEIAMSEAWKLLDDPQTKAALKETDGIGTVATRTHVIKNLLNRNLIETFDKSDSVRATDAGMQFFEILEKVEPRLLDVGLTGEMEITLEKVKSGEVGAKTAVEKIVAVAEDALRNMLQAKEGGAAITASFKRPPSEKMKAAAKAKAQREGRKSPPPGVLSDFEKCRDYLGPMPDRDSGQGPHKPSEKQIEFANKIAEAASVAIPDDAMSDAKALSDWINKHKGKLLPKGNGDGGNGAPKGDDDGRPSGKAISFAERIAQRKRIQVPREAYQDRARLSAWIDANK